MNERLLFDGATGTYYYNLYGEDVSCEAANIDAPERILRIHGDYIDAGAEAIRTNSFGINSSSVTDPARRKALLTAAYKLAEQAAGSTVRVFADIGYIFSSAEDSADEYLEQAELFLSLGAKNIVFETLSEFAPIKPALRYIKERDPSVTVMTTFAVSSDGYTPLGLRFEELLALASRAGADIVGFNCICGPAAMLRLVKTADAGGAKLAALPNTSFPSYAGGRLKYTDNADYFAEKLGEFLARGVYAVGGCCGTTPEHIRKTAVRIGDAERRSVSDSGAAKPHSDAHSGVRISALQRKIENGEFVTAVELDPPTAADYSALIAASADLSAVGADVITVTDAPLARVRADSIMCSAAVARKTDAEVLPHLACRDKNRVAIHGQLLAASCEGLQNILVITGDSDIHAGDKNVFFFNSLSLISYINSLNSELFSHAPFYIAAALNVNAPNFDAELRRAEKKIKCGAKLFLTQAIFNDYSIGCLRRANELLGAPVLAGIMPVAGYKNAVFLNNEVAGIDIPTELIDSLYEKSPEEMREVTLGFCRGLIDKCREICAGFYIMVPRGKTELASALISYIKETCKQ